MRPHFPLLWAIDLFCWMWPSLNVALSVCIQNPVPCWPFPIPRTYFGDKWPPVYLSPKQGVILNSCCSDLIHWYCSDVFEWGNQRGLTWCHSWCGGFLDQTGTSWGASQCVAARSKALNYACKGTCGEYLNGIYDMPIGVTGSVSFVSTSVLT